MGGCIRTERDYVDILDLETRALGFRVAGLYGSRAPAHNSASGVQPTGAHGGGGGVNIGPILAKHLSEKKQRPHHSGLDPPEVMYIVPCMNLNHIAPKVPY